MSHLSDMDAVAIKKVNMPDGWLPYLYEAVVGAVLITGCMTRPKKSGPNKGEPLYLTAENRVTVAVTAEDIDRHVADLENQ